MGIKNRATELAEIANKIAKENNIDLNDYSDDNKKKITEVWNEAIKKFDDIEK